MSIYLKSTINYQNVERVAKCVNSFVKSGNIDKLYYYSIPYGLRKTIFKTLNIPIFKEPITDKNVYPFSKFISKNINVSMGKKCFVININHNDYETLSTIIYFLEEHNKDYTLYIDSEFTNNDLNFIQNILNKFPNRDIKFKLSDIEFSYFQVNSIKNNTIYSETKCLLERLEFDLPPYFEKDISFKNIKNDKLFSNIDIMRFYRIQDKNLGIISEGAMLPKSLDENSIVILQ